MTWMTNADASCGDYLIHGPDAMGFESQAPSRAGNAVVMDGNGHTTHDPQPAKPSPCAGGRCQQAPSPDPIHAPTRVVLLREIVLGSIGHANRGDSAEFRFANVSNDHLIIRPYLEVEVPPPEGV
jgi:hypothetical protein